MKIRKRPGKERRFFAGMALPLAAIALFVAMNAALLVRAGEYLPVPEILEKIDAGHGLYGSAIQPNTYWLKQDIYRRIKPDVAVLGSSRVLQFRKDFFDTSFANLGNMHNLQQVITMAETVVTEHKPKLLVLAVDFWWFNPAYSNDEFTTEPPDTRMRVADLFDAAGWLFKGKLSPRDIWHILAQDTANVGITAIARGDGFDAYGSYYNDSLVTGEVKHRDAKFAITLGYIKGNKLRFSHAATPDKKKLQEFARLLRQLRRAGVPTVVFIPPLAPNVIDEMAQHPKWSGYVQPALAEVEKLSRDAGFGFYNFHDPRDIGGGNCEMLDGVHAGPVSYARLLKIMAAQDEKLASVVNGRRLDEIVKRYSGRGSTLGAREVDFLGLGCGTSPRP
ncbi:MAG: hypothetical protein ACAH80_13480 [Alphaproteobacteria bacterium]